MNVSELVLKGFTKHEDTRLTFPPNGVVLVTGPNGSGKSSLVEGPAWAAWGETLRGTAPGGRNTAECSAGLKVQNLIITRSRQRAKTLLEWREEAEEGTAFPTTSKAQEALEQHIGTFEVWRQTHVFSSADASRFTEATDKERKLFIEGLLGLGRFDNALDRCREDLRTAQRQLMQLQGGLKHAEYAEVVARQRVKDAEETLRGLGEQPSGEAFTEEMLEDLEKKRDHLRQHIKKGEREVAELREAIASSSTDTGGAQRELAILTRRLQKLGDSGTCDACGQAVPEALRAGLGEGIEKLRVSMQEAQKQAEAKTADFRVEATDVEGVLQKLRLRERVLSGELEGAKQARVARSRIVSTRKQTELLLVEVKEAVAAATDDVLKAQQQIKLAEHTTKVLEAAETVLGLRGVRAGIIARMLKELEAAANVWLPRLAGEGLKLELKPYSEKKGGGVSDAIGLQVHGAGGGEGYRATSGGERRRVDLAILLAFAGTGSLFFDEALDALDTAGVQAVAELLPDLAKDRCVVVITHNEELAARLKPTVRWRVQDGKVE